MSWLERLWKFAGISAGVRRILFGVLLGTSATLGSKSLLQLYKKRQKRSADSEGSQIISFDLRSDNIVNGVCGLIGNTSLVRINSLSDALGVEILGKAEFLNPGGSTKDRVALRMIEDAERQGLLHPGTGSRIFEGTTGSTGISLAIIARARGYKTTIILPDDIAAEKVQALQVLGAQVERVKPASIVDKSQFVNLAKHRAQEFGCPNVPHAAASSLRSYSSSQSDFSDSVTPLTTTDEERKSPDLAAHNAPRREPRSFFTDQFENKSNFAAHYEGTGPEIWRQTNGQVHAFVSGAGTGGTLAGTGKYLKEMDDGIVVALADPEGSGLYNKVKYGVCYNELEKEGTKRRHQVDSIVEGIGINRLTANLDLALPITDTAFRITDIEAVSMSRYLVEKEGLFLGSSSACNLFACVRLVKKMGWRSGERIVTILCDSGSRHYSKFWNDEYLRNAGIPIDTMIVQNALKT